MVNIELRYEHPDDTAAIHELTKLAFRDMSFAGGDEQDVIDRLRACEALHLSLVATADQVVVGQVTFSPATCSDNSGPWFALGPVSVIPNLQGEGIGSALINRGLSDIKAQGALGCILTGNPDYYQRFGFALSPKNTPSNEPPEYFQLTCFSERQPEGVFTFHRAFYQAL